MWGRANKTQTCCKSISGLIHVTAAFRQSGKVPPVARTASRDSSVAAVAMTANLARYLGCSPHIVDAFALSLSLVFFEKILQFLLIEVNQIFVNFFGDFLLMSF
jgi:hypothetical protein